MESEHAVWYMKTKSSNSSMSFGLPIFLGHISNDSTSWMADLLLKWNARSI